MFKPTQDNVLLELEVPNASNVTASGIYLPETARKEQPQIGKVVAVGPGLTDANGEIVPMNVNIGDKVMFAVFAGAQLNIDGKSYLVVREREIYGILKD